MNTPLTPIILALVAVLSQDPAKDIKSKDVAKRLAAVEVLTQDGGDKVEALLIKALKDKDWEVVERAAFGLGVHGERNGVKALVKIALEFPVARIRKVAAESAARVDAPLAAEDLLKKSKGRNSVRAFEALEHIGRSGAWEEEAKKFQRLIDSKEAIEREVGARALIAGAGAARAAELEGLVRNEDYVVRASALDVATALAAPELAVVASDLLAEAEIMDVIQRRAIDLLVASLATISDRDGRLAEAEKAVAELLAGPASESAARVVAGLAEIDADLSAAELYELLEPSLNSESVPARAAAAKALRAIGGEPALARARELAAQDASERVRYVALDTGAELGDTSQAEQVDWLTARLVDDDPEVRAQAAVQLGKPGIEGATEALGTAADDAEWTVAACALVSLGKTRADGVEAALTEYVSNEDWRLRGAAIVGLGYVFREGAIEPLIAALEDVEPAVARSAFEGLRKTLRRSELPAERAAWEEWWQSNKQKFRWVDPEAEAERREKYDYAVPDSEIYKGLDIVVLLSRGDHIENVLSREEIEFRSTSGSAIPECGLQPDGIFVANCTGEIEPDDVERLSWFVRTGGSFFGSCWALHETVEKIYPGVLRKLETRGEVLDDVRAFPCTGTEGYLNGVFPEHVRPIYHLEGAHLIEVLDPERAEVLIDSPDAAQRHGGGNLAAWFRAGHGIILDSVNHFDLQGLEVARGLKTPEDRQAYAVDHMGLSYERLRETVKEKFWDSAVKASREVHDSSAFRFVTNFVRAKRVGD